MNDRPGSSSSTVRTRVAHAGYHEHRFFGHRVFDELAGNESLAGLVALSISGRRLQPDQAALLDDMATVLTVADPRIWPLKVARLAASYGGALEGLAASMLCLDCLYVGGYRNTPAVAHLLQQLAQQLGPQADDPACVAQAVRAGLLSKKFIPGFGVPFREKDERVPPLHRCVRRRGRHTLPYWRLQEQVAQLVIDERGLHPNMVLGFVAACLDIGFEADELGTLSILMSLHTQLANATEEGRLASQVLRELPASRVGYAGAAPRRSPRARAAAGDSDG